MNHQSLWNNALHDLRLQVSANVYRLWLEQAIVRGAEGNMLVIEVPDAFTKDWLESHLLFSIERLLCKSAGQAIAVRFVVPEADGAPVAGTGDDVRQVDWDEYHLPPVFEHESLNTLDLSAAALQKPELLSFIRQPMSYLQDGIGLTLIGPPGVGKSHIATGIFKHVVEAGWTAMFLDVDDLTDQLGADADRKQGRARRLAQLQDDMALVRLLVLDDLNPTSLKPAVSQLISKTIKRRWKQRLPLITTSNYLLDDLARPSLSGTLGLEDSALSRLTSVTLVLSLHGFDFRLLIKQHHLNGMRRMFEGGQ